MSWYVGWGLWVGLFLCSYSADAGSRVDIQTMQSFYLGEKRTETLVVPTEINTTNMIWNIDASQVQALDGGEFVRVSPQVLNNPGELKIDFFIPYMAPSFENLKITLMGYDPLDTTSTVSIEVILSVRAELVIRFRQLTSGVELLPDNVPKNSAFEWDLPYDAEAGAYRPLVINNHKKGIWLRFRYDGTSADLKRAGGYLIHIYRGPGEYIVHQPFDKDTHLIDSQCRETPITDDEWRDPAMGLMAKGKEWSTCEFRGYIPPGAAYGFEFREHYLENETQKKRVEISNMGRLNTELIEALEAMGIDLLTGLCSTW